jgi:hypothetical protein
VLIAVLIGATLYLYLELRSAKTQMATQFQVYDEQFAALEGSVCVPEVGTQVAQVKGMIATAEKRLPMPPAEESSWPDKRLGKELEQTQQQHQQALRAVGGQINRPAK